MTYPTVDTRPLRSAAAIGSEVATIRAHHGVSRNVGQWTTARRFDVLASRSRIVLDLLLPLIEPGDIEIQLDLDHAVVMLLVPDGARIDDGDLRRIGRGRVKDWTGTSTADGRRIRLVGELRHAEVRVHRGGVAIIGLMLAGALRDVRQAWHDGRLG